MSITEYSRFAGTSTERQQTAQQPRTTQQEQAPNQTEQAAQPVQAAPAAEETAAFKNPTHEELSAKPDIPVIEVRANSDSKTYQQMKADVFNMATLGKWYDTPRINADTTCLFSYQKILLPMRSAI